MFYDVFSKLCEKRGIRPSRAAEECGINKSSVSNWKNNGYVPRGETLNKIADYFNVTTDYLLTGKKDDTVKVYDEDDNIVVLDDETRELIDNLRKRPEMKMLFSVSKKATKDDIIRAVKIIEALESGEEGE